MPDISSYNAIDVGNIASINGQDISSGGGITTPPEATTGMLFFEPGLVARGTKVPDTIDHYPAEVPPVYKSAIHSNTNIVRLRFGQYHYFGLDSSGVLYSAGYTNTGNMGRTVGVSGSGTAAIDFVQTLTSVAKFDAHDNGAWAIKTDGTLWWCGSISAFADSGDTGQSTTTASSSWKQFGSDTDWIDITCWQQFPQKTLAIKGGSGAQYLYVCGSNSQKATGVGLTSGSTKPFTRVKTDATTDLSESFNAGGLDIGYQNGMAVSANGKLFAWGEGNTGVLGTGNTTDVLYAQQVGTDTDWAIPFVYTGRNAGLCIKTSGALHMSTYTSSSLGIQPSGGANRTYSQVGSDTDYEDFRYVKRATSTNQDLIFAKKNGTWYANWDTTIHPPHCLGGTSSVSAPSTNTWEGINTLLQGNDVTATITDINFMFVDASSAKNFNLWICTSTS